jgi:hypothetical protein
LLQTNQVLAHSIKLRNPYVDPMHLIQVDMLRRKRAGEDTPEVNRAIAATINGISAGCAIRAESAILSSQGREQMVNLAPRCGIYEGTLLHPRKAIRSIPISGCKLIGDSLQE